MVKLLNNEWKRYRLFAIIMIIAAVGIGALLSVSVFYAVTIDFDEELFAGIASMGSIIMEECLLWVMPFAACVYCLLSYISDIGRKGMIFLTPAATWKIILSKMIFTAGMFTVLYIISIGGIAISSLIIDINYDSSKGRDSLDLFKFFLTLIQIDFTDNIANTAVNILNGFLKELVSLLNFSVAVMGCISLARFAANSTGIQVLLSILFYWVVSMIENTLNALVTNIFSDENYYMNMLDSHMSIITWDFFASIIYTAVMYIICVCLTDRKVNLVS